MKTVRISTGKPYDIYIGNGILADIPEFFKRYPVSTRMMIVCGSNVAGLYLEPVKASLESAGYSVFSFVFPAGEHSKTLDTVNALYDYMASCDITRSDIIVALGGGVTGDLAGFAAATYLRGISFVQIPTTLLAAVDSSVGGKTGVNISAGKNLVGAFHQPDMVICDTATFKTLPKEIIDDGTAEVIKYGVIWDADLFELLAKGGRDEHLEEIICRCVSIKGEIVSQDEKEKGIRVILNYGHTLAHGIEMDSDHQISHGRAVAIGMVLISKINKILDADAADITDRLIDCLKQYDLPSKYNGSILQAAKFIANDKKRSGNSVKVVLAKKLGEAYTMNVPVERLMKICEEV